MSNNLKRIRLAANLRVDQLARLTGLSPTTIYSIERPNRIFKIHEDVAAVLADKLRCAVHDIFPHLLDVTNRGRVPFISNGRTTVAERPVVDCPNCFITLPNTGKCDDCSYSHTSTNVLTLVGQG